MSVSTTIIMPIGRNIIRFADHNGPTKTFPEAKKTRASRPAVPPAYPRGWAEASLSMHRMCFGDDGRSIRQVSPNTIYERPACSLAPGLSACNADPSTPPGSRRGSASFRSPDLTISAPSTSAPTRGLGPRDVCPDGRLGASRGPYLFGTCSATLPHPLVSDPHEDP
jgi:hypothetical protein